MKTLLLLVCLVAFSFALKSDSVKLWTANDVTEWLKFKQLQVYAPVFLQKEITGVKLLVLDNEYAATELKMDELDRKALFHEIEELRFVVKKNKPLSFWDAFEKNPSLTHFLYHAVWNTPRLTYVTLFLVNPELLRSMLYPDEIPVAPFQWEWKMLILPEVTIFAKIMSHANSSATQALLYIVTLLISWGIAWIDVLVTRDVKGFGVAHLWLLMWAMLSLILPSFLLKLSIWFGGVATVAFYALATLGIFMIAAQAKQKNQ